jgi:hypothetical protein
VEHSMVLNMTNISRQSIVNISAKLEDSSDSKVVIELFQANATLFEEILTLKKRNEDLVSQIISNLPNYSKIEEELEGKFKSYKETFEQERLQYDVEQTKTINQLKEQNSILRQENESLKLQNKLLIKKLADMDTSIAALEVQVKEGRETAVILQTKLQDLDYQNYIADVHRFIRDGIIAKKSDSGFTKSTLALQYLKRPEELESNDGDDDDDDDDSAIDEAEKEEAKAALVEARNQNALATRFIESLGLDVTLVRELYRMNQDRNSEVHDADCKMKTSKKITSAKNQAALKEIRNVLTKIKPENAAYPIKDSLLKWVDSSILTGNK